VPIVMVTISPLLFPDPDLNRSSSDRDQILFRDSDFSGTSPECSEFEVGSVVEVDYGGKPRHGVIRWIGEIEKNGKKPLVGIETVRNFYT